jgi:hypothetical protein
MGGLERAPQASPSAPDLTIRFEGTLALAAWPQGYHGSGDAPVPLAGVLAHMVALG